MNSDQKGPGYNTETIRAKFNFLSTILYQKVMKFNLTFTFGQSCKI